MNKLSFYTAEYISKVMSLRKPQEKSLFILDDIFNQVRPEKNGDLESKVKAINSLYPTLTDFEREFMSLTFALATGVGKTRLMGAFITYLYTNHGIRNFFIVAPGKTVYEKLKTDLGNPSSEKYVFNGLGCFSIPPFVITDDDYRNKTISFLSSDINLYIFNIDKFNNENTKMHQLNEYLGASFYDELSKLDDLVLLMDESHHYRAKAGSNALNELKPLLGLELTATPLTKEGNKQVPFKNVVFEYPLSAAIQDGYTRTPYALTRTNVDVKSIGEIETDKMMLRDGLLFHEEIKNELIEYASEYNKRIVKPFMLVVCKDTAHAESINNFIQSDEFGEGKYKNKTIMVHSKQSGAESEGNLKLLLDVEKYDNPVEIVIHVNILKEGWDVNNLYTIVPLRTATSQILREQMVGRGLRLPFGKRTGVEKIDMVALTAHDNFNDLLEKARKADSIFKAGNVIKAESLEKSRSEQLTSDVSSEANTDKFFEKAGLEKTTKKEQDIKKVNKIVTETLHKNYNETGRKKDNALSKETRIEEVKKEVLEKVKKDESIDSDIYTDYMTPFDAYLREQVLSTNAEIEKKFIPIPRIKVTYEGVREYKFLDFNLDLSKFNYVPVTNELLIQNLQEASDSKVLKNNQYVDFGEVNPIQYLAQEVVKDARIDYSKSSEILLKILVQLTENLKARYGEDGLKNIVLMFRRKIAREIANQMVENRYLKQGDVVEEVFSVKESNHAYRPSYSVKQNLFEDYEGAIQKILFDGAQKSVFSSAKFDSKPELLFARILERESDVIRWLKPAPTEFELTYNEGKLYEPDFVVETSDVVYLVEVKGEDKLEDADVISKKERAVSYCNLISEWAKENDKKEWKHVFIPSQEIQMDISFTDNLAKRFIV